MWLRLFLAAVLHLSVAVGSAWARDPDLPPLTPRGEFRRVGQTDVTSTEQCIGDPRTPLCAIDTFLAGFLRGSDELGAIALGTDTSSLPWPQRTMRTWEDYILYRVVSARHLRRGDVPDWIAKIDGYTWTAGDIEIGTIRYACGEHRCHRYSQPPMLYLLRPRSNSLWMIVDWYLIRSEKD